MWFVFYRILLYTLLELIDQKNQSALETKEREKMAQANLFLQLAGIGGAPPANTVDSFDPSTYRVQRKKTEFSLENYPVIENQELLEAWVQDPYDKPGVIVPADSYNAPSIFEERMLRRVKLLTDSIFSHAARIAMHAKTNIAFLVESEGSNGQLASTFPAPQLNEASIRDRVARQLNININTEDVNERQQLEAAIRETEIDQRDAVLRGLRDLDSGKLSNYLTITGDTHIPPKEYMEQFENAGRMVMSASYKACNQWALGRLEMVALETGRPMDTFEDRKLIFSKSYAVRDNYSALCALGLSRDYPHICQRPVTVHGEKSIFEREKELMGFFKSVVQDEDDYRVDLEYGNDNKKKQRKSFKEMIESGNVY